MGAGKEVVGLAASAGLILDDPQADVLIDGLGESNDRVTLADGSRSYRWSTPQVAIVEPRQNGKGAILEARALGGMFLFREPLIVWTAHEFKTAREGFLRVRSLVENYDHLRKRVKAVRVAAGEEGIELLNGCRLRFLARSGGSGRGFSGDCIFLDEAYALTDEQMAALLPTVSARPNSQIWYPSSAPLALSTVLRRICKTGRHGESERLAYFEWCAEMDADPRDPAAWAQANPALGIRIQPEAILAELDAMGPDEFARERLGIWHEDGTDEQVIDPSVWQSLTDGTSRIEGAQAFAVDIAPDRKAACIAVAGRRADGKSHVEVVTHGAGTGWIVDRLVELAERWEPCAVVLDPTGQAGSLIKTLNERGFKTDPVKGQWQLQIVGSREMAQACGAYQDAAVNDTLRHIDQVPLNLAVSGAKTRPLADAYAWSRKDSSVDITPLVTTTLALHGYSTYGLIEPPKKRKPQFAYA